MIVNYFAMIIRLVSNFNCLFFVPSGQPCKDNVNLDGQKKEDSEEHKLLFLVVGMFQQEEDLNSVCVRNIARSFISETETC